MPGVLGEIQGVLHSKLFISDNYTIITGANLSQTYFTNRQDRYFIIQDCEPFADYCEDFINALANVSYTTNSCAELLLPKNVPDPFRSRVEYIHSVLQQFKMFKYDNRVKIPLGEDLKIHQYFENIEKFNNNYKYRPEIKNLIEFKNEKKEFLKVLISENKNLDLSFLSSDADKIDYKNKNPPISSEKIENTQTSSSEKVLIFPSFQFYNLKQFDDEEILKNILDPNKNYFSKIKISSGYLNLSNFIIDLLKKSNAEAQIITSSPRANSFYKAGFFKKNIPYFYRRYEQLLLDKMSSKNNFSLYEFSRENWSFHSKGFWLYEHNKDFPTMTIIGSSNYNSRSFRRDIESQFYFYSFCENFGKKLQFESEDNFTDAKKVSNKEILLDKDIKLKKRHKLFAYLLKNYL